MEGKSTVEIAEETARRGPQPGPPEGTTTARAPAGRWASALEVLYELTKKEIKVRYKSNVLGYLWSVLNPLAQAFTFYVAFKLVMKTGIENYSLFLITGLFPWQWFSNSVQSCTRVYIASASLIRKVAFTRELLPLATVLNDLVHFLLSIPVIAIFLWCADSSPSLAWLYGIPALVFAQLLITFGLSLLVASLNLFFRDLEKLVQNLLMMWFYFTPVVWSLERVPEGSALRNALLLNPLCPLLNGYRDLFLRGEIRWIDLSASLLAGIVAASLGYAVHRRLRWRFAEVV